MKKIFMLVKVTFRVKNWILYWIKLLLVGIAEGIEIVELELIYKLSSANEMSKLIAVIG